MESTGEICRYSAVHQADEVPATTVLDCGPVGQVPACESCAAFFQRMGGQRGDASR